MALNIGTRLGTYEVFSAIGAGSMGEVYRARDTKLGRDVALKILPDAFVADPERLARFDREAKTLASLNHPNIAQIYGFEESGGTRALVMELVAGEDLSQRIALGPILLADALAMAKQIADALEAAHEQGIVHRDLKPANIKVRDDGTVKVLDFGLAKALDAGSKDPAYMDLMNSPTMTRLRQGYGVAGGEPGTEAGIILGTAAYMSPEQARGKVVDKRADIWAFGCVVYETLTGKRAFEGETLTDVLAAVVKNDPDWNALAPDTPRLVRSLLRRCLQKDPGKRLHDIADARIEIQEAMVEPKVPSLATPERRRAARWTVALPWIVTAVLALASGGAYVRRVPVDQAATKLSVLPPENAAISSASAPAISPDGRRLAFVAKDLAGKTMLWVRPLDSLAAQPLLGTEDADQPFWSPNNRFLAFFSQGRLRKIDASGGAPQTVCDVTINATTYGGTWNADGVILFASSSLGPIQSVPDGGGQPRPATAVDRTRQERGHVFPHFLPDGRHFLYLAQSGAREQSGVYVGSLGSSETKRILNLESEVRYAAPGYVLFVQGGTIMARPFDADRLALGGDPSPIADRVVFDRTFADAMFSVSDNGVLAYRSGGSSATRQLQWFDRAGKPLNTVGAVGEYLNPELSADGRRIAVERIDPKGDRDIWLLESPAGTAQKFTFTPGDEYMPVWSPDGNRIVYAATRPGTPGGPNVLYQKASSGVANENPLYNSSDAIAPAAWSSDGLIVFRRVVKGFNEAWILPPLGDRVPFQFLQAGNFTRAMVQISPHGKWAAYYSNETGRPEVYVQGFPKPAAPQQVSVDGGIQPRWSRDETELYYLGLDGRMMAVEVKSDAAGLRLGARKALFQTPQVGGARTILRFRQQYDVARDGRFLINVPVAEEASAPMTIVQNWAAGLKK